MSLTQLRPKNQITLPSAIVKKLGLHSGDYIDITAKPDRAIIKPKVVVDKNQAWFWTEEWQKGEKEADQDIKAGRVSKEFDTAEDAIKNLRRGKL